MFPEFKFTADGNWAWWRDLVLSRLQHHLSNDFYPDGVQFETSPSYHSLEYRNLFFTYKLIVLNGIFISENLRNLFIKPLEFMMHIHKPDGYLPQLSDTDRKSYLSRLKEGAELFDRQDMIYAATKGNQGNPPVNTFVSFPQGGYFVMRSDWGQNQTNYADTKYLVFDTGSNDPWHAHYDILNFEAYANGFVLLRDAGRYTYTTGEWRDYFKNSTAHNTIVIDNQNQKSNISGEPIFWTSLPGFDYVSGSHQAYSGLTHERRIFFAKPEYWIISDLITGTGNHSYDLYFHIDSPYYNHINLNISDQSVSTPNFIVIPSNKSASAEIINGWVSNSYNSKLPAPIIKYHKQGSPPVTFETILFPYDNGVISTTVEKLEVYTGQNAVNPEKGFCLKIRKENRTDWFYHSSLSPGLLSFQSFECDGRAAFISIKSDNSISNIQLVQGSLFYRGDTLLVDTDADFADVSWFQNDLFIKSENIQYAKIWAPQTNSVLLNSNPINFVQNGNYVEWYATGIQRDEKQNSKIVFSFQLEQNYPNPFNQSTSIRFILQKPGLVSIRIYDLLGQQVAVLINDKLPRGAHQVLWNGKNKQGNSLSSGIYIYRVQAGNQIETRRMLLLR